MNGAFGAGFLCGWSEHGSRPTFDFVTGISAGALLSPFAFLGTNYDAALLEIYSNLQPKDLFRRKGLMRILRDDSAFDTTPLRKLLEKYVTKEMLAEIAREHARGRRLWIGTVNGTSDRNAKEKFTVVSPRAVLEKVAALPISEWNFKNEAAIRHIGPMAQDFHAAFSVGMDDKHIATVDEGGVALAAIQGLNQKVEDKNTEIANLKARLEKLEELLCHKPKGGTR